MRTALIFCAAACVGLESASADGLDATTGSAGPDKIIVKGEGCRDLIEHFPSPDVAASNVDAYGRPVAPADLDPVFRPPVLHLLIEAPTIERQTWRSEPRLMELTIDLETGEISSRGRPVPGLTSADLVKACERNPHD